MIVLALFFCIFGGAGCGRRPPDLDLEVLPERVLLAFSLLEDERPEAYALIADPELLEQAGIPRNPSYTNRKSDREVMARVGGVASFLALYGPGDSALLVLNGIFFPDLEDAMTFAEVQKSRERPVAGFQRRMEQGAWMVFFALDPEASYAEGDMVALRSGLARYRQRLELEVVFDQLDRTP